MSTAPLFFGASQVSPPSESHSSYRKGVDHCGFTLLCLLFLLFLLSHMNVWTEVRHANASDKLTVQKLINQFGASVPTCVRWWKGLKLQHDIRIKFSYTCLINLTTLYHPNSLSKPSSHIG